MVILVDSPGTLDDAARGCQASGSGQARRTFASHAFGPPGLKVMSLKSGLISKRTGREFPPTLAFNYPTINALTRHLIEA